MRFLQKHFSIRSPKSIKNLVCRTKASPDHYNANQDVEHLLMLRCNFFFISFAVTWILAVAFGQSPFQMLERYIESGRSLNTELIRILY